MQHNAMTTDDYLGYGNDYYFQRNFRLAIRYYTKAITEGPIGPNPNHALIYNNRGAAYYHLMAFDDAIVNYNKAIVLNPHDAEFFLNRANAYMAKGLGIKAIAD